LRKLRTSRPIDKEKGIRPRTLISRIKEEVSLMSPQTLNEHTSDNSLLNDVIQSIKIKSILENTAINKN
jgi:hypothetical protein